MPPSRKPRRVFTPEFKSQMVQLYHNRKRKCDIIKEYDVAAFVLDKWIKQAETTGSFEKKDNRSTQEQEIIKLKKELKQLQMENDILKQAALILGQR
ncbi:transposase IS3/IS911 family protein [Alkaliphilus metalliredigens QYMF]|uniref:Transposase IS3/IS911 family protein n=1 Tax=Alkaliphilus metalliredigens (strain QYMF) TaxID=293826 RepID=A6TX82_ALKMQ|nr:transposase IS3/IS911 family protein [Alkaliphilus metalliredigens QYMF]